MARLRRLKNIIGLGNGEEFERAGRGERRRGGLFFLHLGIPIHDDRHGMSVRVLDLSID